MRKTGLILASLAVLSVAACQPKPADPPAAQAPAAPAPSALVDVVDTALATADLTKLVAAIDASGIKDTLKAPGPYTLFAPNDAAFAKMDATALASLMQNQAQLAELLKYHVVAGKIEAAAISAPADLDTLAGKKLHIEPKEGMILVGAAQIVAQDVQAANGAVHVIDTVLTPPAQ